MLFEKMIMRCLLIHGNISEYSLDQNILSKKWEYQNISLFPLPVVLKYILTPNIRIILKETSHE